jgi:hypothetical protein
MTVIRHWLVYAGGVESRAAEIVTDAGAATDYAAAGYRVEGPFVPEQLQGAVEITDEMCAAALKAERSQRWNSDELRVWAMLAAARDAAGGQ